ncbi:MAG TPA: glucose-6-phosphate dehydrogenase [Dehalococcoidia bacterium]|nr:glucose-6-phosphate dehydrogenase [Dehalococcoidia bacterium]
MTTETLAENPLREGLRTFKTPEPATIVIFGGTGDLAQRKIVPALYDLATRGLLPARLAVLATSRREVGEDNFRSTMRQAVERHARSPLVQDLWESFAASLHVQAADPTDANGYRELTAKLAEIQEDSATGPNKLFYLAVPPNAFAEIAKGLGESGLAAESGGWSRIVIEKPFGSDRSSGQELNDDIHRYFSEDQIFRIDHYLGKETVQNILVLRFANSIFEPLWSNHYIDRVELTVAETLGVEGRGAYYEEAGAMRDIVQNHMLQVLSLVAMEPPASFEAETIRDEKVKVLRSLRLIAPDDVDDQVLRGQYVRGDSGGQEVPGYREEEGVDSESLTETYVAIKAFVDNWRWAGTPFFLRTGKRLARRVTEVAIHFKSPPHVPFTNIGSDELTANLLAMRIQPDEGITLRVGSKAPSAKLQVRPVNLEFLYGSAFLTDPPEAYETLLLDALVGDHTLFPRADEVDYAWRFVDAIRDGWRVSGRLAEYEAGSWGPAGANALLPAGASWREP